MVGGVGGDVVGGRVGEDGVGLGGVDLGRVEGGEEGVDEAAVEVVGDAAAVVAFADEVGEGGEGRGLVGLREELEKGNGF